MPNFITHSIHGMKVLNIDLFTIPKVFLFGCQASDFFFYRNAELGQLLHKSSSKSFLDYLIKNSKTEPQKFYTLGYMCHQILDEITHPYINSRTKNFKEHTRLEFIIDTILLEKILKKDWYYKFIGNLKVDEAILDQISELYIKSLKEAFNIDVSKELIKKNYNSMVRILNFFHDPRKVKAMLVYVIKLITLNKFDYTFMIYPIIDEKSFPDPLNLSKNSWIDSNNGKKRNESFIELFELAIKKAIDQKNQVFSTTL